MKAKKFKTTAKTPSKSTPLQHNLSRGQSSATLGFSIPSQLGKRIPTLVVVITFLTFLPVLKNGFVDWDNSTLVGNLSYRGFGLRELQSMIATLQFGQYQPLVWLTFALDFVLWWMDPFGYHWTSLLLHIGSAVVFYHVALHLISPNSIIDLPSRMTSHTITAGLAALIFAIHPLRVEPVAWASGRPEILSGLLILLSAYSYLLLLAIPLKISAHRRAGCAFPSALLFVHYWPDRPGSCCRSSF